MHPTINRAFNGYTSDHTIRRMSFSERGGLPIINGSTWNTLNRCHGMQFNAKLNKTYSNNPLHIDETASQYEARKMLQIQRIVQNLRAHNQDFMFLQEVDFIQLDPRNRQRDPALYDAKKRVRDHLYAELAKYGYGAIESLDPRVQRQPNHSQQPLMTLYNQRTLGFRGATGILPIQNAQNANGQTQYRYRGLEVIFEHRASQQRIALSNLHLDYNHNYVVDIDHYLTTQTHRNNMFTVAGGDTNHAQNSGIEQLMTDWHHASNLDSSDGTTLSVAHNAGMTKSYDGFVMTPSRGMVAVAQEQPSEYFTLSSNRLNAQVQTFQRTNHTRHESMPGRPWKRNVHLARDIDREIGNAQDQQTRRRLLDELTVVVGRAQHQSLQSFHDQYRTLQCLERLGTVRRPRSLTQTTVQAGHTSAMFQPGGSAAPVVRQRPVARQQAPTSSSATPRR